MVAYCKYAFIFFYAGRAGDMELTFGQQVIVAVIGGIVASILTSILNNWWTDRRLRDQWEQEKEERQEQWRREQEARRREWKRQYRTELLRPLLEKVDETVAIAAYFILPSHPPGQVGFEKKYDLLMQQNEDVCRTLAPGVEDEALNQLIGEFMHAWGAYVTEVEKGKPERDVAKYLGPLKAAACELYTRAEEWLEETFD
jgi:hypothetical protein